MRIFLNKASRCFEVSNLESFTPICLSSDTLLSSTQIPLIISGPMTGPFGYQKQLRLLTETARLVNSTYFHNSEIAHQYFKNLLTHLIMRLNSKVAEFVGILLGDGQISNNLVGITTNGVDDREYIKYLLKLIKDLFNFEVKVRTRKNDKAVDIKIYSKNIVNYFLSLGMIRSPKWKRATIPERLMNKKFGKFILRGYFDTDGCVAFTKRTDRRNQKLYPRLEMKFSPSPMQKQFVELLKMYNFNFREYPIYKENRGRSLIRLNGIPQIEKWMKTIGTSNPKHYRKIESIAGVGLPSGYEP